MLLTSQWQRWELFAPEPDERNVSLEIAASEGGAWIPKMLIDARSFSWWRRADELKILREITKTEETLPILERYGALLCSPLGIPSGTALRLRVLEGNISSRETRSTDRIIPCPA
jgi:hypothetical protein